MMKQTMVSVVVLGFLLASCGGGGGSTDTTPTDNTPTDGNTTDNTPTDGNTTDNTPNDNNQGTVEEPSFTGDGSQTTIDNTATLSPANYAIPAISEADKQRFLDAINVARSQARDCKDGNGIVPAVNPLTWSDKLYSAAYEHNYDMANTDKFTHNGSGTQYDITGLKLGRASTTEDRVVNSKYFEGSFTTGYGENLAAGNLDIEHAMELWLNSPGHCANLMSADFEEMGMSKVKSVNNSDYYYFTHTLGVSK